VRSGVQSAERRTERSAERPYETEHGVHVRSAERPYETEHGYGASRTRQETEFRTRVRPSLHMYPELGPVPVSISVPISVSDSVRSPSPVPVSDSVRSPSPSPSPSRTRSGPRPRPGLGPAPVPVPVPDSVRPPSPSRTRSDSCTELGFLSGTGRSVSMLRFVRTLRAPLRTALRTLHSAPHGALALPADGSRITSRPLRPNTKITTIRRLPTTAESYTHTTPQVCTPPPGNSQRGTTTPAPPRDAKPRNPKKRSTTEPRLSGYQGPVSRDKKYTAPSRRPEP
jgi:hypothetical protein